MFKKLAQKLEKLLAKALEYLEDLISKDQTEEPQTQEPVQEPVQQPAQQQPAPQPSTPSQPAASQDDSGVPKLNWCWGGFNGSKAVENTKAQIKNLKVSNDGMSYAWAKGGCEALGAKSSTDCDNTLACLFLADGRGGKFDWISTSRTTRDFKNIHGSYNGWSSSAFKSAKTVWFCICSRDGKQRTNLIKASK